MSMSSLQIAVVGAGPAGLMAAEVLADAGAQVTVYDRMASAGRKFLLAGRGGLNLTHSEDLQRFLTRYGEAAPRLRAAIEAFPPSAVRQWCEGLGQETFIGSSGRVFPKSFKTSPLLRAWLWEVLHSGRTAARPPRASPRSARSTTVGAVGSGERRGAPASEAKRRRVPGGQARATASPGNSRASSS